MTTTRGFIPVDEGRFSDNARVDGIVANVCTLT